MQNVNFKEEIITAAVGAVVTAANNIFTAVDAMGVENLEAVRTLIKEDLTKPEDITAEYSLVLRRLSNRSASVRNAVERVANLAINELLRKQFEREAQAQETPEAENNAQDATKAGDPTTAKRGPGRPATAKNKAK